MNLFLLTKEKILQSSTLVIFCGVLGFLVWLSWPVQSFIFSMYQTVDLSSCYLYDRFGYHGFLTPLDLTLREEKINTWSQLHIF